MRRRTERTRTAGKAGESTRCVHAGSRETRSLALAPPIYQTATFRLPGAAAGARFSSAVAPAELYTRWGNPTLKQLEAALAELEGGEAALVAASGMAAASIAILTGLKEGDHVVGGRAAYAGVLEIETELLPRFGIESTLVENGDAESYRQALRPNTRLILVETPANPTLAVTDLAAVARIGRRYGIRTVADNTFATPINQNPLRLGIDTVFHSATKALAGHSDVSAGAVVGSREFIQQAWLTLKLLGPVLNPFDAWLVLRGVRTLALRVRRQNDNGMAVARFLARHPAVSRVFYPGLPEHPGHRVARRQMSGFGGLLSFELKGGLRAGVRLVESLKVITLAVSLGGVETLIQHPASMTHTMIPRKAREEAGITDGLIRFSCGIEDAADLIADLEQGLKKAGRR
jgi:cystathionine beta-lyase/cystathionine gamma-synthase